LKRRSKFPDDAVNQVLVNDHLLLPEKDFVESLLTDEETDEVAML
jgi:hypothetical protein